MKYAAASCGVSKEVELFLVKLLVLRLCTLILDIFLDGTLRTMLPDRSDKVAIRPKLAAPELPFDFRATAEDFPRRDALDELHDSLRAVVRNRLDEEMHVIFVCPNLQKRDLVSLGDLKARLFELCIYSRVKYYPSVLRHTDTVVHQYRDVMTLADEFAHPLILAQQAAGHRTR